MTDDNNKKMLNETQAAEMIGLKVNTMRTRRARKQAPIYFKIGGKVYYDVKDLKEFMESGRVMPTEDKGKQDD